MTALTKVFFRLEQDEDDYPPVAVESLWAIPGKSEGEYILDNIPFFVRDATLGDTVKTRAEDGGLWFDRVTRRSSNSLMRAVFFDQAHVTRVTQDLTDLGCIVEYSSSHKILAIGIPDKVELSGVQAYLNREAAVGSLDFEEPILRQ